MDRDYKKSERERERARLTLFFNGLPHNIRSGNGHSEPPAAAKQSTGQIYHISRWEESPYHDRDVFDGTA